MLKLTLYNDSDVPSPCEWDGSWKLYSFCRKHVNFRHPDEFGITRDGASTNIGFRQKLKVGLAFVLGYFEHGNSVWFPADERPAGTEGDFRWDGVAVAGVLVWEKPAKNMGAESYEDRAQDAKSFLEEYTAWANGECYGYSLERVSDCGICGHEVTDEELESCGGFIGDKWMFEKIRRTLADHPNEEITVEGEAKWLADYNVLRNEAA